MNPQGDGYLSRNLSMGEYLRRRYEQTQRPLTCIAQDERSWCAWRTACLEKLRALMGPWPDPVPLEPLLLERTVCDGYTREKIIFSSEADMAVPAYILIPTSYDGSRPYPALVCQHGHGYGKDDVVGITHGEYRQWTWVQDLHYAYAAAMAQQGYVVIAMDARGFGERALGYPTDAGAHGCNMVQIKAQLLGINLLTLSVFDLLRCVDYLATRPEVDRDRIGCIGLSTGGTLTLFASALDERIKLAVVSGYLTSFYEQTFIRGDTCGSQTIPNLSRWLELADVACLLAPRPLLVESGTEDPMFEINAARRAVTEVQRLYTVLDATERLTHHIFDGGHRWDGAPAKQWLAKWL